MQPPTATTWAMLAAMTAAAAGCGQTKFEKEVQTEKTAVKLAREVAEGGYSLITTDELHSLLKTNEDVVLVDAMPYEDSYKQQHIRGAKNFAFPKEPMEEWNEEQLGGKRKEVYDEFLGEDRDKTVVVYCGFVACARSHNAALFAKQLGYNDVRRYPGGIYAWKGAGYATEAVEAPEK